MMEKFTPGPWEFGPDANEDEFPIVSYEATGDGDEVEICQVNTFMTKNYESPGQLDMDRVIANARLIAAAPQMLEALESWSKLDGFETDDELTVLSAQMEAAIKAAKGEV